MGGINVKAEMGEGQPENRRERGGGLGEDMVR